METDHMEEDAPFVPATQPPNFATTTATTATTATTTATTATTATTNATTATTATTNNRGLQASIHFGNNTSNTTAAKAKAQAIKAAQQLADLATKIDSKAAHSALSDLVTSLAYWSPLEITASLITKAVKDGLQAATPKAAPETSQKESLRISPTAPGPSYAAIARSGLAKPTPPQSASTKTTPLRLNKELLIKPGDLPPALQNRTPAQIVQAIQTTTRDSHAKGIRTLPSSRVVLTLDSPEAKKRYEAQDD
jgi:hypothetical protein